ncbi:MAG: OmpH family outer membrane protein [Paracoccaceae bacterium]|nr:OmpH family outer membrane protein [Paracoccaceae bacterium]
MRYLVLACLISVAFGYAPPVRAQDASFTIPPPILTIDQERLLAETRPGARLIAEIEDQALALAQENEAIEAELTREERELTEQRASMEPAEFRALADAFDAKVQGLRAEQEEKARQVNEAGEQARQAFLADIAGVISDIVLERRALVVLDRRDVFLSADRIDITNEAIRRVNAAAE